MDSLSEHRKVLLIANKSSDVGPSEDSRQESSRSIQLDIVEDGTEARAFLRREGSHAEAPRPDLVVLDLDLPRDEGLAILREIKSDPNLRSIPVIAMSSSGARRDMEKAYALEANCCIHKPQSLERFCVAILSVQEHWFTATT